MKKVLILISILCSGLLMAQTNYNDPQAESFVKHGWRYIGESKYELYQPFRSAESCVNSLEAIKYCNFRNMKVESCSPGELKDFASFCHLGGDTPGCDTLDLKKKHPKAIVQCGGSPDRSPFCQKVIDRIHSDMSYVSSVCETYKTETEFNQALSCLPQEAKEKVVKSCPRGCANSPKVIICDWTEREWEMYKGCQKNLLVHTLRRACPEGNPDLDPDLGNPPRVSITGDNVTGKDGGKLSGTFSGNIKVIASYIRGNEGTFCLYKRGQSCSSPAKFTTKDFGKATYSVDEAPGEYTIEVTAGNGLKTVRHFTIADNSSHAKNFEYCRMRTGFACTKDRKEIELFYLCGEKPSGEGWMDSDDGKYFRYTSRECDRPGTNNYRYVDATTTDSNTNYVTTVTHSWQEFYDPWFKGANDLVATHSSSHFRDQSCPEGSSGKVEKDTSDKLWVCTRSVSVAQVAQEVNEKKNQCLYYDYKNANGDKVDSYLEEGTSTVRNIISAEKKLVSQKIKCEGGKLVDLDQVEQGAKCEVFNYLSLDGRKTTTYLDNGATIARQIIKDGALKMQTVRCRKGELEDIAHISNDARAIAKCTAYNYTSTNGKYDKMILKPYQKVTRKIIVNGELVDQRIECRNGELSAI